jgi:hypothetical protein
MTTELVLLLCVFAFVTAGAIFGEKGPFKVLESSSPRLGARLEQNIAIGHSFKVRDQNGNQDALQWQAPQAKAPTGKL